MVFGKSKMVVGKFQKWLWRWLWRSWTPSACQGLSSTAPAHKIKPRGNSQPVQLVLPVPGGKDISAPVEDLPNKNPSLALSGKKEPPENKKVLFSKRTNPH